MAMFIKQNEPRSELQQKIAADLANRLKTQQFGDDTQKPQPAILDDQAPTSSLAWLWAVVGLVVVAVVLWLLINM